MTKPIKAMLIENTYRRHVRLLVTPDRVLAGKWMAKQFGEKEPYDIGSRAAGHTRWREDGGDFCVWLHDRRNVSVMSHELCHVVIAIMNRLAIPVNVDTDEAFCYLYQHLMHQGLHALGHGRLSW